jgi:uncharacterized protein (TIGR01777 family)
MARLQSEGHETVALVRRDARPGELRWEPSRGQIDSDGLEGTDAVVHLSGAGIGDRRWSAERKKIILGSRVESTGLLCGALATLKRPPSVLVSASAIGYYGDRGDEVLTETSGSGAGFQAEVCRAWEAMTEGAEKAGIRVVHLRSAVVLSRDGGALGKQLPLFRAGVGGRLGSGRQWFSWITQRDEVGAIVHALRTTALVGAVNASAPTPVTNREFTKTLGRAVHRPAVMAVPPFALRIGLGKELADELLLGSLRVMPARLVESGYRFEDPTLGGALEAVLAGR